jgi:hypothetical protein
VVLTADTTPATVKDGRFFARRLEDLTADEFAALMTVIEDLTATPPGT